MSAPGDGTPPAERLVDARRRLYMPNASEADLAGVIALEAAEAELLQRPPEPTEAGQTRSPRFVVPRRSTRTPLTVLLGGIAVSLVVFASVQVIAQARLERRRESSASAAAAESISLRQLLTRYSSVLPSEWQGAPIVASRERVRGTTVLPVSTSASAEQHLLVIRCGSEDGGWSARIHAARRPLERSKSGSCSEIGFVRLPRSTDAVQIRSGGAPGYSVVVLAHA